MNLDATFLAALARDQIDDLFLLARIEHPKLPTQRLSLVHRSLDWGPTGDRWAWAITDGTFGTLGATLDAAMQDTQISFSNLDGTWFTRLNENREDLNGAMLTLLIVFASVDPASAATSALSRIEEGPFTLSGAQMNDDAISFGMGAPFNAMMTKFPAFLARVRRCQFTYHGPLCKSASDLPSCGKTTTDCAARHPEVLRFSSWPFSDVRIVGSD